MTVAKLENELGSGELTEWHAFDSLEPFGEARSNWPSAMLASMFANRYSKKGASLAKPTDFLFNAKGDSRQKTTENTFALMDKMAVDKKDGSDKT